MRARRKEADTELLSTLAYTPARESDLPFVFSTWLHGYKEAAARSNDYYDAQHALIERLIEKGRVLVARGDIDDDWLCGYLCSDVLTSGAYVVHWAYVKDAFRGRRVATSLMAFDIADRGLTVQPGAAFYTHRRRPFSDWGDRLGMTHVPL